MPSPDPTRTEHGREAREAEAWAWLRSSGLVGPIDNPPTLQLAASLADLLTAARQQGAREAAEIADVYAQKMEHALAKRPAAIVPECKADAGRTLAAAIRAHFGIGEKE